MPITLACIREEIISGIFTFKAPRLVRLRSFKIGLFFRLMQFALVGIVTFIMLYFKLYQKNDPAQGSVLTEVRGIADTRHRTDLEEEYRRIWDVADYVSRPMEEDALFIMTHVLFTINQTFSTCAENPDRAPCSSDADCEANTSSPVGNGVMTGNCIFYGNDTKGKAMNTCEIEGWCPTEKRSKDLPNWSRRPLLPDAVNFTVVIINHIEFEEYGIKGCNMLHHHGDVRHYMHHCRYHVEKDPYCPVFRLGYIFELAGITNVSRLLRNGGVIRVDVTWDCNLDHDMSHCKPKYSFARLDTESEASKGWNFRFGHYYHNDDGKLYRDLVKVYGVVLDFYIHGEGGKFNVIRATLALGSIAAIFSFATALCDFFVLYVFKFRARYEKRKYADLLEVDFVELLEKGQSPKTGEGGSAETTSTFGSGKKISTEMLNVKTDTIAVEMPNIADEKGGEKEKR